jgi:bifunctional non-homologous end joining protein LigD
VPPSKEDLAAYWEKVWNRALAHLGRRPLKLVRHVKGTTFYHKAKLPPVPEPVRTLTIEKRERGEGTRLWVDSLDIGEAAVPLESLAIDLPLAAIYANIALD